MAAPQVGVFLQSVTWGSLSLDANAGGIQSIDFSKAGEPLAHWSGDDILPRFQSFVRQLCDITISTAATVEAAEKIEGIPDPKGIRELILKQRGNA